MRRAVWLLLAIFLWWNVLAVSIFQPTGFLRNTVFVPAAWAYGRLIWYAPVAKIAQALKAVEPDVSRGQALDQALQFSLRDAAVRQILRQNSLSPAVDSSVVPLDQNFMTAAEWSEAEYKKIISQPFARRALAESTLQTGDVGRKVAEDTLLPIRQQIIEGMPFSGAAEIFSDDSSAAIGGNLGALAATTAPAWMAPVFNLAPQEITDVLAEPSGYWLLTRQSGLVWGIRVRRPSLEEILADKQLKEPPLVFIW